MKTRAFVEIILRLKQRGLVVFRILTFIEYRSFEHRDPSYGRLRRTARINYVLSLFVCSTIVRDRSPREQSARHDFVQFRVHFKNERNL